MELADFSSLLNEKCAVRDVRYESYEDFFREDMLAYVEDTWEAFLQPLMLDLPPFELIIKDIRPQLKELLNL